MKQFKVADGDPYKILSVDRQATLDKIKISFRKLSLRHHPDKGGDAQSFARIRAAFELLSDAERRKRFDAFGSEERPGVGDGFAAMVNCFEPLVVGAVTGMVAGCGLKIAEPHLLSSMMGTTGLWAGVSGIYAMRPSGKRAVEALNFGNVITAVAVGCGAGLIAGLVFAHTLLFTVRL